MNSTFLYPPGGGGLSGAGGDGGVGPGGGGRGDASVPDMSVACVTGGTAGPEFQTTQIKGGSAPEKIN